MIIGLGSKTQSQKYIGRTMTPLISTGATPKLDNKQTKQNLAYGCLIMDRFRVMKEVQEKYHSEWCGPDNESKLLSPTAVADGYRGDYVCPICQAEVTKNAIENQADAAVLAIADNENHSYVVPEDSMPIIGTASWGTPASEPSSSNAPETDLH